MLKSHRDNELTNKNAALLNWILCESGVHNITFNPKECKRLFNVYQTVCKEEDKETQ
jgi:hypothetical protein|tara:strand:+ start:290 stop:460 length:171 start_codon:yes stop_codon:yes gene_type:complete